MRLDAGFPFLCEEVKQIRHKFLGIAEISRNCILQNNLKIQTLYVCHKNNLL